MSYNTFNVIYIVFCPCYLKYIGEMGASKTRLRDRARVYRQHIKPKHQ